MTPNEYQAEALRSNIDHPQVYDMLGRLNIKEHDLLHAQLGILTEAGEIADTIKKHIFYNQPLDYDNIEEEIGDILWYIAVLCNVSRTSIESAMIRNIEKLKIRYPEKFTEELAKERLDKKSPSVEALDKQAAFERESRLVDGEGY